MADVRDAARRCAGGAGATRRHAAGAAGARARVPARDGRRRRRASRPPVALAQRAPARPPQLRAGALAGAARDRRLGERSRDDARRARAARRGQGLPGPRAAARAASPRGRPTPSCAPPHTSRWRRCWRCARASRWRSCRSAAARAWSAAWRRCAARHGAVVALDLGRMGGAAGARPRVADRERAGAGRARPRSSDALGGARAHARPLPAVLRVRLARRLRGDALGRAGLDRLRRDREDGARPATGGAGGRDRAAAAARQRRRPGTAPAARRLGGHARRDHRAVAARAPGAGASASTRASSSRASTPAWQALRALAREHALPDVARLSDEQRDAHVARARRAAALSAPRGAPYLGARGYGDGCLAILGFEGARERGRSAARARARAGAPRAAASGRAPRPGGRGCARASRRPTCATSCSPRA